MRISQVQARRRFAGTRVARLATADRAARPHLVPVTFAVHPEDEPGDGEDLIVTAVDHKPKSTPALRRLRNITENPEVSLLADEYDDDWSRLWWARADGRAELGEAAGHPGLVAALVSKYSQYGERSPAGTLIIVRVHRWSGWCAA